MTESRRVVCVSRRGAGVRSRRWDWLGRWARQKLQKRVCADSNHGKDRNAEGCSLPQANPGGPWRSSKGGHYAEATLLYLRRREVYRPGRANARRGGRPHEREC
jgi:hypothetical protein